MSLSPVTTAWFSERYGEPTPVQKESWAALARGEDILLTAPTGSGKTLAAFLWFLDLFYTGSLNLDGLSILYISPLKALNNDIARNLSEPLTALEERFGPSAPRIRIAVRSGDTEQKERSAMTRNAPHILVTTPESLAILLTSKSGSRLLGGVRAVIVDEIHQILSSKRGSLLALNLERLAALCGDFRRVGVSATMEPLELARDFLGGLDKNGKIRPVFVIAPPGKKRYQVDILLPEISLGENPWLEPARIIASRIKDKRSTLVFVNSRRVAERLAGLVNEIAEERLAWPHHGSLSRDLRLGIEDKLKNGELRAVIATGTLELGIDIGWIDEVILVQAPATLSSCVQRMGRAGHQVGAIAKVACIPLYSMDLLFMGLGISTALKGLLEPLTLPEAPLDVLAQFILSVVCNNETTADQIFALTLRAWPYRNLERSDFDSVLSMLAGAWTETGVRELETRLIINKETGLIKARPGTALVLYASGGSIPDRGLFDLRSALDNSHIGTLDEEFVWERRVGERFVLGSQNWQISSIEDSKVLVIPTDRAPQTTPFWRAEAQGRDPTTQTALYDFIADLPRLADKDTCLGAIQKHVDCLGKAASERLASLLYSFMLETNSAIPGKAHILIETCDFDRNNSGIQYRVLHSLAGLRYNTSLALALATLIPASDDVFLDIIPSDNAILICTANMDISADLETAIRQFNRACDSPELVEELVNKSLASSRLFGAVFRENAGRALLINRGGIRKRLPLWVSRRKARNLLESIEGALHFPLVRETWKELHARILDLPALASNKLHLEHCTTSHPSILARDLMWHLGNITIYENDKPSNPAKVPELKQRAEEFTIPLNEPPGLNQYRRLKRRTDAAMLSDKAEALTFWLIDRVLVDKAEWLSINPKLPPGAVELILPGAKRPVLMHESLVESRSPAHFRKWLEEIIYITKPEAQELWGELCPPNQDEVYVDKDEFQTFLGWQRKQERLKIHAIDVEQLGVFLSLRHGLASTIKPSADLVRRLEAFPIVAVHLENYVLQARWPGLSSASTKELFDQAGLVWTGYGNKQACLIPPEGSALVQEALGPCSAPGAGAGVGTSAVSGSVDPFPPNAEGGAWDFWALERLGKLKSPELSAALWNLVRQSRASNDDLSIFRQGVENSFQTQTSQKQSYKSWQHSKPLKGRWFKIGSKTLPNDALTRQEYLEDLVVVLLNRWGIICRDFIEREAPTWLWHEILPVLRRRELGASLICACFVDGLAMPQFMLSDEAHLPSDARRDDWYWVHNTDPASLAGLDTRLQNRNANSVAFYKAGKLIASANKDLAQIQIFESSVQYTELGQQLVSLGKRILERPFNPPSGLVIETINGIPALEHDLSTDLVNLGFRKDVQKLRMWRW